MELLKLHWLNIPAYCHKSLYKIFTFHQFFFFVRLRIPRRKIIVINSILHYPLYTFITFSELFRFEISTYISLQSKNFFCLVFADKFQKNKWNNNKYTLFFFSHGYKSKRKKNPYVTLIEFEHNRIPNRVSQFLKELLLNTCITYTKENINVKQHFDILHIFTRVVVDAFVIFFFFLYNVRRLRHCFNWKVLAKEIFRNRDKHKKKGV